MWTSSTPPHQTPPLQVLSMLAYFMYLRQTSSMSVPSLLLFPNDDRRRKPPHSPTWKPLASWSNSWVAGSCSVLTLVLLAADHLLLCSSPATCWATLARFRPSNVVEQWGHLIGLRFFSVSFLRISKLCNATSSCLPITASAFATPADGPGGSMVSGFCSSSSRLTRTPSTLMLLTGGWSPESCCKDARFKGFTAVPPGFDAAFMSVSTLAWTSAKVATSVSGLRLALDKNLSHALQPSGHSPETSSMCKKGVLAGLL